MMNCPLFHNKTLTNPTNVSSMSVFLWRVYPNWVELDWYITLLEKNTMKACDIAYTSFDTFENTKVNKNILPSNRIFVVGNLSRNLNYSLCVACKDQMGHWHLSNMVNFSTSANSDNFQMEKITDRTETMSDNYSKVDSWERSHDNNSHPRVEARYSLLTSAKDKINIGLISWRYGGVKVSPHTVMGKLKK